MTAVGGRAPRWRPSTLRLLGACMVGLGMVIGLVFPFFLDAMDIAAPEQAGSIRSRLACLTAGILLGGINYLLARFVVGRRLRRLTGRMRRVDEIVRTATETGDWSLLHVKNCQLPVDSDDELGETALAFNALVDALDRNVAERQRLEATLHHQAFHDDLTGLANRALFADRTMHALTRTRRELTEIAVLFLDLDGFKDVNDSRGHAAGDAVLTEVSRRVTRCVRATDTVARLGGDEFAVLLEDIDVHSAARTADELCERLRQPVLINGERIQLGASIGISHGGPLTDNPDDLLRQADFAMYLAKRAGKGCYRVFEPGGHVNTS